MVNMLSNSVYRLYSRTNHLLNPQGLAPFLFSEWLNNSGELAFVNMLLTAATNIIFEDLDRN